MMAYRRFRATSGRGTVHLSGWQGEGAGGGGGRGFPRMEVTSTCFWRWGPAAFFRHYLKLCTALWANRGNFGGYDRDVRSTPEWDVIEPMVRQQPVGGWEYEGV